LVPDPSRRIAGALFVAPENGKSDSRPSEKLRGRSRHLLISFNEGSATTYPQKYLRVPHLADMLDAETIGPVDTSRICTAERVTALFEPRNRLLHRLWKLGFFHHKKPAHIDNFRHLFNKNRTSLHARDTGCALPERCR